MPLSYGHSEPDELTPQTIGSLLGRKALIMAAGSIRGLSHYPHHYWRQYYLLHFLYRTTQLHRLHFHYLTLD